MKGTREIRRRLKSVNNIKKITKAMEMVAATKLRRLMDRSQRTAPFARKIEELIRRVADGVPEESSPLLRVPEKVDTEAVILVTADRGLCGAYNSNMYRAGSEHLRNLAKEGVTPRLTLLGRRAEAFFPRTGAAVDYVYDGTLERISYNDVKLLAHGFAKKFLAGEIQRVRVVHTAMKSAASFAPSTKDLLPIPRPAVGEATSRGPEYILEPSAEVILERLLPRFLEMRLYSAILESLASEFASRRIAMKNATDNAKDMMEDLTRQYNKARQSGITSELLDIAGGMAALNG